MLEYDGATDLTLNRRNNRSRGCARTDRSDGRTDNFLWGISDIDDTIRRLSAYAEAGADVLYAPNLPDRAISAVIRAVAPKPVNVLVSPQDAAILAELQTIGVRRISLGSTRTRTPSRLHRWMRRSLRSES
jgi:2-methylisocitrate lyase-like PEP mutase family enzyme